MAELIRMPRLSDTMAEGVIVAWNKKVGDTVKSGDVLAEVETDKATMELESYQDGTLLYIGVPAGQAAKVDGILAVIGKAGESFESLLNETTAPSAPAPIPVSTATAPAAAVAPATVSLPAGAREIRMPLLSDTMTEGKIVAWNKRVGDTVKSDDVLAEVETDKATMDVVGYEDGTLLYIGVEAGKAAKINEIIAIIGKPGTDVSAYVAAATTAAGSGLVPAPTPTASTPAPVVPAPVVPAPMAPTPTSPTNGRIKASPLAKKLAGEKGIDLSLVSGSGDGGRITKKDIVQFQPIAAQAGTNIPSHVPVAAAFVPGAGEGHTDIPVTQMRKVIARRLGESMYTAPHFYLTMEINMDEAIKARATLNELSPVKISFNDIIIKASAMALRRHPVVNSSWISDAGGDLIRQHHHIHIGSAVALPEGLIVPVIRFADQKSLAQIAQEAKELYGKARDKKLQPQEFSGNTFSISNLGMMDIEEFTAIINPPDSCILAVGRIKEQVVHRNGAFTVTQVMKITLSCDHRTVDGAAGAAFLQTLRQFLENPVTMLV